MHVYRGWRIGKGPCMVWNVRSEKAHEKRRGVRAADKQGASSAGC